MEPIVAVWSSILTHCSADILGGPDGLRIQNIEVKRDWWDLFTTAGGWLEQAPYTICRVLGGPPSCSFA